jgi:hypothetical protein
MNSELPHFKIANFRNYFVMLISAFISLTLAEKLGVKIES